MKGYVTEKSFNWGAHGHDIKSHSKFTSCALKYGSASWKSIYSQQIFNFDNYKHKSICVEIKITQTKQGWIYWFY